MKEGDIFKGFTFDWEAMKELILKGIFEGVQEQESFSILDVPRFGDLQSCLGVVATEKCDTRVDWLDLVIGDIWAQRDHSVVAQQEEQLLIRVTELRGDGSSRAAAERFMLR